MKKNSIAISSIIALGVCLTTAAKGDVIVNYAWVQGDGTGPAGYANADSSFSSSGFMVYDVTKGLFLSYTFKYSGSFNSMNYNYTDTSLLPLGIPPYAAVLPDNNLLVSTPPGSVLSLSSDGYWYDNVANAQTASPNENVFILPNQGNGAILTGDWVPTAVPEAGTVMAAALLLLPLGVSTVRILRRNSLA